MSDWQKKHAAASEGLKFLRREYDNSIYEVERTQMSNGAFVRERMVTIEAVFERVVWASDWRETERLTCHCCTCDEDYWSGYTTNDPACRNHGFAGTRPCDIHNLPGSTWEDTDEMPDSVLTVRKKQAEALEKEKAARGEG
ncbi:hypothetical protein SEA_HUWBERT_19 [Microbacterium phage Huwbert]|nr:hypothetical protein SEA_HUWBERT_19 [Microbacterium phage Huwbert]